MKLSRLFNRLPASSPSVFFELLPRFMRPGVISGAMSDATDNRGEQLVCPEEYLRLFQLKRAHSLLWMQVEGDDRLYQTVILHVDTEEPFILVDEPFPADGVLDGLTGKNVTLLYSEDGQQQALSCQLLGKAGEDGAGIYQLSYPENVVKSQRREMYRLPVQDSENICLASDGVSQWLPGALAERSVDPVVLDISVSGMRWAVQGNQQVDVHAGKLLENLNLSVPGCGEFKIDFDITHSQWVPALGQFRADHTIVGGSFVGLDIKQVQRLERYITLMQRQQRREQSDEKSLAA